MTARWERAALLSRLFQLKLTARRCAVHDPSWEVRRAGPASSAAGSRPRQGCVMGSITLDSATVERLTGLDPSLAGLAPAMQACSPNGPWSLHDIRWTPGHGCRLAYVERAKDAEPTFVAVEVSGEEWGRYAWRDDTELPALITATDPDEVARRLEIVLGEPVRSRSTPVRYRPGSRCVLRYDVEAALGPVDVLRQGSPGRQLCACRGAPRRAREAR